MTNGQSACELPTKQNKNRLWTKKRPHTAFFPTMIIIAWWWWKCWRNPWMMTWYQPKRSKNSLSLDPFYSKKVSSLRSYGVLEFLAFRWPSSWFAMFLTNDRKCASSSNVHHNYNNWQVLFLLNNPFTEGVELSGNIRQYSSTCFYWNGVSVANDEGTSYFTPSSNMLKLTKNV